MTIAGAWSGYCSSAASSRRSSASLASALRDRALERRLGIAPAGAGPASRAPRSPAPGRPGCERRSSAALSYPSGAAAVDLRAKDTRMGGRQPSRLPAPEPPARTPRDAQTRLQGLGRAVRRRASCWSSRCIAEEVGFDSVVVSDHFQPWRHTGGHAPFSFAWLAALGERTSARPARHQRRDPDLPLPSRDRRPGDRHARLPLPRPRLARRRHRRIAERGSVDRHRRGRRSRSASPACARRSR